MDKNLKKVMIRLFAEVLPLLDTQEERMIKLEEFDEACGADIPDWEDRMKETITEFGHKNAAEAIAAVDAFHAKNHVFDENGKKVFERTRIGNGYHQLVITFDASAPAGQEISVREVPDIESMTLSELQDYYDDIHAALDELEDEEPEDEDTEEHKEWEDRYSQMEDLVEEVGERLEEMGGDV